MNTSRALVISAISLYFLLEWNAIRVAEAEIQTLGFRTRRLNTVFMLKSEHSKFPCWVSSFDTIDIGLVAPLEVYVDMSGRIIDTDPEGLFKRDE